MYEKIVRVALREDIGKGDVTTTAVIPRGLNVKAGIFAGESGVVAGLDVAESTFKLVDKRVKFKPLVKDGQRIRPGQRLVVLGGPARSILMAERTALNFLGRLSGIATLTDEFVQKVRGYKVKIMDTRKTTPGLRDLEKYAVRVGGGHNHRMGLYAQVLIKDNHLRIVSSCKKGKGLSVIQEAIRMACEKSPRGIKIEVEVSNLKEFESALNTKADIIMLDNMSIGQILKAVALRKKLGVKFPFRGPRPLLEVSGRVTIENVKKIASTGVDMISIGALTHSARALDMSLEII